MRYPKAVILLALEQLCVTPDIAETFVPMLTVAAIAVVQRRPFTGQPRVTTEAA